MTINSIELPDTLVTKFFDATAKASVFARASRATVQTIGDTSIVTLSAKPKMQIVTEGDLKDPSGGALAQVKLPSHTGHVTMRFSNKLKWQDQEVQTNLLNRMATVVMPSAVAEGLDVFAAYGLSHLDAVQVSTNHASATTNSVELAAGEYDAALKAAVATIITKNVPDTVITDGLFAFGLGSEENAQGNLRYPNIGFGTGEYVYNGLSGYTTTALAAGSTKALVYNSEAYVYGINPVVNVEVHTSGDPDGLGDLARRNEFALRTEVVFTAGWVNLNDNVAKVVDAA